MADLVLSKSQKQMMKISENFSDLVRELIEVRKAIDNDGMLHLRAHKMYLKQKISHLTTLFQHNPGTWFETIGEGKRVRKVADIDKQAQLKFEHANRNKASRRAARKRIEKGPKKLAA